MTIKRKLSAHRRFLRFLGFQDVSRARPAGGSLTGRIHMATGPRRFEPLRVDELAALVAAPNQATPKGVRDRAILILLATSSLGVSELCSVDARDIDLSGRQLTVALGTGECRQIALTEGAAGALGVWLATRSTYAPDTPAAFLPIGALTHGAPPTSRLGTRGIRQLVDRYLVRAGLKRPGVSAGTLRKSFAMRLLTEGCPPSEASSLMGVSPRTMRAYASLSASLLSHPSHQFLGRRRAA